MPIPKLAFPGPSGRSLCQPVHDWPRLEGGVSWKRRGQAGHGAHVAPFVRDPLAGARREPASDSGGFGPQEPEDHDHLHARHARRATQVTRRRRRADRRPGTA